MTEQSTLPNDYMVRARQPSLSGMRQIAAADFALGTSTVTKFDRVNDRWLWRGHVCQSTDALYT